MYKAPKYFEGMFSHRQKVSKVTIRFVHLGIENAMLRVIFGRVFPLKISRVFLEVFHLLFGVGDDGVGAGFPPRRTHLSVLVGVLKNRRNVTFY